MHLCTLHELDHTEGTVRLRATQQQERVLVPRPSATDPNDPLRWAQWRKDVAFGTVCAFTFLSNFGVGGLAPAFYLLAGEFDRTAGETSALLLWPILVMGAFNFVWVPLGGHVGKRPVFVAASALLCAASFWGARASSFRSLLWSNIVAAFAASASEALGASVANDLFFLHERGARMGVYMNSIAGGNTIGPLICGFVATRAGWRWHKYLTAMLAVINFAAMLFFLPDTRYERDADQNIGVSVADDGAERLETMQRSASGESNHASLLPTKEKAQAVSSDVEKQASPSENNSGLVESCDSSGEAAPVAADAAASRPHVPLKTWRQQLTLWPGMAPGTSLVQMFLRPLPMFAYPCVIFGFLAYAVALVLTVAVNILNSFVLQAPPYSWSPMINGLINIPGFIGNFAGSYAGGWLVDVFCDWQLRGSMGGVFEPEARLPLLALPALVTGAGCLVFGYGVQHTLHWTSLFFGYGMVSFALTAVPTITMAYVSDCLLPVNADALMLVNGSKNIVAFGFLYGIVPWVEEAGYVDCFGALAGIFVGIIATGAGLLMLFGARIRHRQAQWRIILC